MNTVIQEIPARKLEWKEVGGFRNWDGALKLEEDGWRLPLTRELVELSGSKLIIPSETYYWSASKCDIDKGSWVVYLPSGRVDVAMRRDTYRVLLVRELSQEDPARWSLVKEVEDCFNIAQLLDTKNPELENAFTGKPSSRILRQLHSIGVLTCDR